MVVTLRDRVAVVTGASEGIGEAIVRRLAAEGVRVAALARRIDKLKPVKMQTLRDRVAVVTGASEGIGEAIVRRLAAEGVRVAALARRIDKLKGLENELRGQGLQVTGYACDVQKVSDIKKAFDKIDQDLGAVSILVNNAGIIRMIDMLDINLEATAAVLNTNVLGPMGCMREALASMKAHSITDGHIININSIAGHRELSRQDGGVYSASKHALRVLTDCLRKEIAKNKLQTRVTSISPGMVKTSMPDYFWGKRHEFPLLATDNIADGVVYAIKVPSNVNISEMIIEPV